MLEQADIGLRTFVDCFAQEMREEDCYHLLKIFFSERELDELANRMKIFILLSQGKTQREIADCLGVGVATVSRGAKVYQQSRVADYLPHLSAMNLEAFYDKA